MFLHMYHACFQVAGSAALSVLELCDVAAVLDEACHVCSALPAARRALSRIANATTAGEDTLPLNMLTQSVTIQTSSCAALLTYVIRQATALTKTRA